MISRLTATACALSILATASLAFAADGHHGATVSKAATTTVQLERVVITGKRLPAEAL